ncbi:MAG: insulinase family protein [Proteobacteria bacterium]|nr:insulinase family protein [Burkholderiales bacterium]
MRARLPLVASLAAPQSRRVAQHSLQSHILIGTPAASRSDPDFFAMLVGNQVLGGGGFASRLTTEVREKRGFAYSVFSSVQPWLERGPFQIALQTRKDQADEALAVVRGVLDEFLAKGPTDVELGNARRNLINGFPLRIDTNREVLDLIAMIGFYDLPPDWLTQWTKQIERVNRDDVVRAFRRLDPERMVTVVVGAPDESAVPNPNPAASPPRLR